MGQLQFNHLVYGTGTGAHTLLTSFLPEHMRPLAKTLGGPDHLVWLGGLRHAFTDGCEKDVEPVSLTMMGQPGPTHFPGASVSQQV